MLLYYVNFHINSHYEGDYFNLDHSLLITKNENKRMTLRFPYKAEEESK